MTANPPVQITLAFDLTLEVDQRDIEIVERHLSGVSRVRIARELCIDRRTVASAISRFRTALRIAKRKILIPETADNVQR